MKKEERIEEMRQRLHIWDTKLLAINGMLQSPDNETINRLLEIIDKLGGPKKINAQAKKARNTIHVMNKLKKMNSPYVSDLIWLKTARDTGQFIPTQNYRKKYLGKEASKIKFNEKNAVTLEISALQYFPWLIEEAKRAIRFKELMPGRFIRVRNMAEQIEDNGDTLATHLAMRIIGASCVETLDTKGLMPHPDNPNDGPANCHLGGPDTIAGYFGGVGQPNDFALRWAEEMLHYYTKYGIDQVLNINAGTIMLSYLMHMVGIDIEFKISVFMGNDNEFSVMATLLMAHLFRRGGSTSLVGFNLSNSADNNTIRLGAQIRELLGLTNNVRFEHHITETQKSIVIQPYNRREELVEVAREVSNIAAKHEGGDPGVDAARKHPSDILEYFLPKEEILSRDLMDALERNYLDKHDALNMTAEKLTEAGIGINAAQRLH